VVEFLLNGRGGQLNPNPDTYGPPPLGRAIQIGDERLVSILLEYGADPTASHGENTMVELARWYANNAVFSLIQNAVNDLPTFVTTSTSRMSDWLEAKRSMLMRTSSHQGTQQRQQHLRQQQRQFQAQQQQTQNNSSSIEMRARTAFPTPNDNFVNYHPFSYIFTSRYIDTTD
jgi:hypothetical protein